MIQNQYIQFTILIVAISRLTLIAVRDDIFKPVRKLVFKYSPPEDIIRIHIEDPPDRKAGWWGQVFDCPDCMGPYVATLAAAAFYFHPVITSWILLPFAASMITSLIARRY